MTIIRALSPVQSVHAQKRAIIITREHTGSQGVDYNWYYSSAAPADLAV